MSYDELVRAHSRLAGCFQALTAVVCVLAGSVLLADPAARVRLAAGARPVVILTPEHRVTPDDRATRDAAPAESAAAMLARAENQAYNLDHDEAVRTLAQAATAYPGDATVQRAQAVVTWLHLLFKRGQVLVDFYLGPVSRQNVSLAAAPTDASNQFQTYITRAVTVAEQRVAKAPDDVEAQYALGAALGLQASYSATIDGRMMGAFSAARRAYNAHERVLALAPARKDAAMIVGTYRYLVANLSMPARWMAYVAGFGGGRELGLQMIEEAAAYHGTSQTDAKFALVLLYNRERQYDKALGYLRQLREEFPRNRVLWLESGSTLLRAGRPREAEAMLSDGIARLTQDRRLRMAGEDGLWYYKRGVARAQLKADAEARADFSHVLHGEAQGWILARTHLELGKLFDRAGDRTQARAAYDKAIRVAGTEKDTAALDEARRLKDSGYKG